MTTPPSPFCVRAALVAILLGLPGLALLHGQEKGPPREPVPGADKAAPAWTLDEATAQLQLAPNDPYLQYVTLQLARRGKQLDRVAGEVEWLVNRNNGGTIGNGRANDVDLFSLFTGALAVQESLQLDAMRGGRPGRPVPPGQKAPDPTERRKQTVVGGDLVGPTIKSHPWLELLGGVKLDPGPLARAVPDDFYFVEFRSLNKLLDALELSDLWGTHLFSQATRDARTQKVGDRLKAQLALETNPLLRPAYDLVVDDVAVTGSDLFLGEGSDVTLLFRARSADALKTRMDGFLDNAAKAHKDAKRTTGKYGDVEYVHLETPDRSLCVYSAWPAPDLHVRGNSRVALERVLAAVKGKDADGKAVRRLGDTAEFQYIRTLMPRGAKEEDGLVYLSDPFIRRLMGPTVRLTERGRMLCYNHLRMIGHAALLYRTEHGKAPASLDDLVKAECLPGKFNEGDFTCPDGGTYALSADGRLGTCSHHGHAQFLTPCCEIPVKAVNGEAADEYKAFLDDYNRYWRTYFDPIALRVQITPQRYRLETIVLPLIDNSIYTSLSQALGGTPEALDALPVPKRNIFSVAVKLNKLELLKQAGLGDEKPVEKDEPNVDNLRVLALAMINYADTFGKLPAPAIDSKDGKPLFSWRVAILPFVEQDALYKEFHLDEPWDSDHNKKLIAKMPKIFRAPGSKAGEGKTTYLLPVGKGAPWETSTTKLSYPAGFTDGTSNTVLLVDAADDRAVTWTKPDDLKYDAADPRKGLAVRNDKEFLAGFADSVVRAVSKSADKKQVAALFTPSGGEVIELRPEEWRVVSHSPDAAPARDLLDIPGVPRDKIDQLQIKEFLTKGIGNQVGFHVYDSAPAFDFNVPQFLGLMMGTFNGRGGPRGIDPTSWEMGISFLVTALNSPVYVSIPVQDTKVVDDFLDRLDPLMAEGYRRAREPWPRGINLDFYKAPLKPNRTMRVASVRFGPVKWRMFWARIGNGLYIASKAFILDDLVAAEAERGKVAAEGPKAHGLVRVRAANWDRVLPDYRLGWAEANREACLNNLGPLASVGRAVVEKGRTEEQLGRAAHQEADRLYGVHFFCPDGGRYLLSPDGKTCRCSVHGTLLEPVQQTEPSEKGSTSALKGLSGLTASLTFRKDGLHAVVEIDRK